MDLQEFINTINGLPKQQMAALPPMEKADLEAALQRSVDGPEYIVDSDGVRKRVNKVEWFKMNKFSVSIRSSAGALFDMPLHVDEAQATRILSLDYGLNVEFEPMDNIFNTEEEDPTPKRSPGRPKRAA